MHNIYEQLEVAYRDSAHALRYPPRSQRGSMNCTAARAPLQANMADQVMRTGSHACMSVQNQCSMHEWRAACMHANACAGPHRPLEKVTGS